GKRHLLLPLLRAQVLLLLELDDVGLVDFEGLADELVGELALLLELVQVLVIDVAAVHLRQSVAAAAPKPAHQRVAEIAAHARAQQERDHGHQGNEGHPQFLTIAKTCEWIVSHGRSSTSDEPALAWLGRPDGWGA